jgi:hypothetical protein
MSILKSIDQVFLPIDLVSKLGVSHPTWLFQKFLDILGPLHFQRNFGVSLPLSTNKHLL